MNMKKHLAQKTAPTAPVRSRRRLIFLVVVVAIVAITPIIVISRQKLARAESPPGPAKTSGANTARANNARTFVTTRLGGQNVQIDTQSGEIKPLTAQEAEKLAEGLKQMLNQNTSDLPQVRHADGSVSMNIDGRFQNVTVARVNQDGTISQSCVDNARAAGKFFGIDPKQIENAPTGRKRPN
jgi:uncharacterized membrane protein YdfJ with MMPL/SSD domain